MAMTRNKFSEIVSNELSSMSYVYDELTGRVICNEPIAVTRQPGGWFRRSTVTRTYPVLFRLRFNQLILGGHFEMEIYYSQQKFPLTQAKLFVDKLILRSPVLISINAKYVMDVEPENVMITYDEKSLKEI